MIAGTFCFEKLLFFVYSFEKKMLQRRTSHGIALGLI